MPLYSLHQLPIGVCAFVDSLRTCDPAMRRRLLDMGLTQGAKVTCMFESFQKDPRAYLIRGAVIALRREEAEKIAILIKEDRRDEHEKSHSGTI